MRPCRRWLDGVAATPAKTACGPLLARVGFDHDHAAWTALLARHVVPLRGGQASLFLACEWPLNDAR